MKIKSGDNVIVLSGTDKGKKGKVLKAFPRLDKVLVEGVNVKKRHKRSTRQDGKGQIIDVAHPIHVSNVRKADETEAKKPAARKATTAKAKAE